MKRVGWGLVIGLAVTVLVGSCWQTVQPGEVVVVRRFGRVLPALWEPGGHWGLPFGVDQLSRVSTSEVRRVEFGRVEPSGALDEPGDGEFLTGDHNLVRVRGVVEFRVSDPVRFSLGVRDQPGLWSRAIEASVARVLSARSIDQVLRDGRPEISAAMARDLQGQTDRLGLGVLILGLNLTDARPPTEVQPAFAEAQTALSTRDRRLVEAKALLEQMRPTAQAEARRKTEEATAEAQRRVALASASAATFLRLVAEAKLNRSLTINRVYRESLRELLPRLRRKVVNEQPMELGIFGK